MKQISCHAEKSTIYFPEVVVCCWVRGTSLSKSNWNNLACKEGLFTPFLCRSSSQWSTRPISLMVAIQLYWSHFYYRSSCLLCPTNCKRGSLLSWMHRKLCFSFLRVILKQLGTWAKSNTVKPLDFTLILINCSLIINS